MYEPLVTIGVTCYNNERHLGACLDSVLSQTYRNIELIVVDDCSTDGCPEILGRFRDKLTAIQHATNTGGLIQGRKDVIAAASGEFIHHLDADDYLEPQFVARLIDEFQRDPQLDWVAGNLNVVDENGNIVDRWDYRTFPTDPLQALYRGFQTVSVPVPKNGLFKMSFIRDNGLSWYQLPHTAQGEDAFTCIKYLECNPRIKLVPEFLVNYRVHGQNMSAKVTERIKMAIDLKEYYIEQYSEMVYLRHPLLIRLQYNSAEYLAFKYYLLARDFLNIRTNFSIPTLFHNARTEVELAAGRPLFDGPIRKYAALSLQYSSAYRGEVEQLLSQLDDPKATDGPGGGREAASLSAGRQLLQNGNFSTAVAVFESILGDDPSCLEAHRGLAEAGLGSGDLKRARRAADKVVELATDDARAHNDLGVILSATQDYCASERHLERALSIDRDLADAHHNLCQLWGTMSPLAIPSPERKTDLLRTVQWLSDHAADPARQALLTLNHSLRSALLQEYHDLYRQSNARILLHRPGNGALKYLMDSWCAVLNYMGIDAAILNWKERTDSACERFQPTLFITVADPAYINELDLDYLNRYRRDRGLTFGHVSTFEHRFRPCDFLITFHLDPSRDPIMSKADLPLLSLPFAINPLLHYMRPGVEVWDYFFVGTNSPFKTKETADFLWPIVQKYNGILSGTNWGKGIGELPIEEAALLYNFARVYPNYHVRRQMDEFNELNERTYIIPACGGFELTDNPVAMAEMFNTDEMPVACTPAEYHEMFQHYLSHPELRLPYIEKGMQRVWRDYTLFHVLSRLCDFLRLQRQRTSALSNAL
ncbi:MAG TPA: glycosyltransferase [Candidatus Deferrimicrobium sp.]|nr:glycosyltransferase [Candidatus Deferrimicrobium sp.]